MRRLHLLLAAPALLLAPMPASAAAQPASAAQASESATLAALFKDSDEASLRRNPLEAVEDRLNGCATVPRLSHCPTP